MAADDSVWQCATCFTVNPASGEACLACFEAKLEYRAPEPMAEGASPMGPESKVKVGMGPRGERDEVKRPASSTAGPGSTEPAPAPPQPLPVAAIAAIAAVVLIVVALIAVLLA